LGAPEQIIWAAGEKEAGQVTGKFQEEELVIYSFQSEHINKHFFQDKPP